MKPIPSKPISFKKAQPSVQPNLSTELQRWFGYPEFRPPQEAIVQCALKRRDAIAIMPTGGGKSICFQLPALMQPGVTLVISPLVALMENQVKELRSRQLPAALLHSELPKQQYQRTLEAVTQGKLRLLYLSPETLLSPAVWQRLIQPTCDITAMVLDEAHCLVQWGDTFRPAYYRLGIARSHLLQVKRQAQPDASPIPIAAFTATADPAAQQTIQRVLQLEQPQIFRLNPYRANLNLKVQIVWTPRQRKQRLLHFIQSQSGRSGLVYVRTRRDSEALADWLRQQHFSTAAYHAGLGAEERRQVESGWLTNQLQFVVCTNAFGMGINKPDVSWIVHFHAPTLLSEYVQEVGRAGRNGKSAIALTLISEPTGWLDQDDRQRRQFFANQTQKQVRAAQALIRKLPLQGDVAAIHRQFPDGAIALSLLHSAGCLEWVDPFHYKITGISHSRDLGRSNQQASQHMIHYLHTNTCRWQWLLTAFGFAEEAASPCGHCDNCR